MAVILWERRIIYCCGQIEYVIFSIDSNSTSISLSIVTVSGYSFSVFV